MLHTVVFPQFVAQPELDRGTLSFKAIVDGKPVKIVVTEEALVKRFGARSTDPKELQRVFLIDHISIQDVAKSFIQAGHVSANGDVRIEAKDVMRVVFNDSVRQWSEGETLVRQATAIVDEVVGDSAPQLTTRWERDANEPGRVVFLVVLSDATGQTSAQFTPEQLRITPYVRSLFYRLWGDLLRIRSDLQHRKVQQLLAEVEED